MGPLLGGIVLLAVTSMTAASSPGCEELLKPVTPESPQTILGKWIYVMGAGDPASYHRALDSLKSSWVELGPGADSRTVALRWGDRCFGRCIYGEVNATVSGLSATFRKNLSEHKGQLLQTCSGCLLWTDTFRNQDFTGRNLLQFTRSGRVDPRDVEIFKKQLQCLNFPLNFHSYDGKIELCPDDNEQTQ